MNKLLPTLSLLLTLTFAVTMHAQTPSREFANLIGEKAAYIDQDMGKAGYMHMKTEKSGYDSYSYWWNYNNKKCMCVRTSEGRIASVVETPAFDCNQADPNAGARYEHNAHHHENNAHYANSAEDAAFDRGYKDGLYNKSYHNYYGSNIEIDAYSQGYNKGVNERNSRTDYHSGYGGYQAHVGVDHLVGRSTDEAFRSLQSEGFVRQNERTQNGRKRVNWYNSRTGQCIKTILDNGRIYKVEKSDGCD